MASFKNMKILFLLFVAVLCFGCCSFGAEDRTGIGVTSMGSQLVAPKVTVSVTNDGLGPSLVFILRNDGVSELTFNQSDLPWFPNHHTSLVLVTADQPDRPIGPTLGYVGLLPGRVTIPSGGNVDWDLKSWEALSPPWQIAKAWRGDVVLVLSAEGDPGETI